MFPCCFQEEQFPAYFQQNQTNTRKTRKAPQLLRSANSSQFFVGCVFGILRQKVVLVETKMVMINFLIPCLVPESGKYYQILLFSTKRLVPPEVICSFVLLGFYLSYL